MSRASKSDAAKDAERAALMTQLRAAEAAWKVRHQAHIDAITKPANPLRITQALPRDASKDYPYRPGGWVVENWRVYDPHTQFRLMFGYADTIEAQIKEINERVPMEGVFWREISPVFPTFEDAELFLKRWLDPNYGTVEYDEHGNRV